MGPSRPPSPLFLAIVTAALLAGCVRDASAPPAEPSPAAAIPGGTLKELAPGDRACYLVLVDASGERSMEGDFELCPGGARDATGLIGQRVTYAVREERVPASSCQGDPECRESDVVDLVVSIAPVH